jgi:hypothetical protein
MKLRWIIVGVILFAIVRGVAAYYGRVWRSRSARQ